MSLLVPRHVGPARYPTELDYAERRFHGAETGGAAREFSTAHAQISPFVSTASTSGLEKGMAFSGTATKTATSSEAGNMCCTSPATTISGGRRHVPGTLDRRPPYDRR